MRPREGLPEPSQHVAGLQGCHSLHSLCARAFPGAFSISDSQTPMFESPGDLVKTDLDPITLRGGPRFCVSNKLPGGTPAASEPRCESPGSTQPAQLYLAALPKYSSKAAEPVLHFRSFDSKSRAVCEPGLGEKPLCSGPRGPWRTRESLTRKDPKEDLIPAMPVRSPWPGPLGAGTGRCVWRWGPCGDKEQPRGCMPGLMGMRGREE